MKPIEFAPGLYRGRKPDNFADLQVLDNLQVQVIVSLEDGFSRWFGWKWEAHDWQVRLKRAYITMPMSNFSFPERAALIHLADAIQAARVSQVRVYIHCKWGRDRTGMVIAMWRVRHCGWSPEAAYDEAVRLGHKEKIYFTWREKFYEACK